MSIGTVKICAIALACFLLIAAVLVLTRMSLGAEVTVNATAGNAAPTVGTLTITPSNPQPGTQFYVAADVSDPNGREDINTVNVTCYSTVDGGAEWTDSWDSIKHLNTSYILWTPKDTSTYTVNATFNTSVNYWSSKSISGSWTCKIYANDSAGASSFNSGSMSVGTSAVISLFESSCTFDSGSPGENSKQWGCPTSTNRNNTVQHDGNININVTINATPLTGMTDPSWVIGVGNMTWNQTTGAVPTVEDSSYPEFTGSPVDFITVWSRGNLSTLTRNTTNSTLWLDYPTPLELQTYNGTITFNAVAA